MKSSKAEIHAKYHKIPVIHFEDQRLTSFSGLLIFQLLFRRRQLKKRLKKCFDHLKLSPIFGRHLLKRSKVFRHSIRNMLYRYA